VTTFCERPGYVHVEGQQRLADFWVRYVDRQELVVLDYSHVDEKMPESHRALDGAALPIRSVSPADLVRSTDSRSSCLPSSSVSRSCSRRKPVCRLLARHRSLRA
jgi:hypothetical protein